MPLNLSDLPRSSNVQGYWKLGEAAGATRADETANANNLTDTGTVGQVTGHEGGTDKAASFASGKFLSIADASQTGLDLTGAFTICGWLKPGTLAAASNMSLVSKGHESGANTNYYLWVTDSGGSVFNLFARISSDGTSLTAVTGGTALSNGTWYFYTLRYTPSSELRLYINAVSDGVNTTSIPASLFNGGASFRIGSTEGSANEWTHDQDEVVVWNVALTDAEIQDVYLEVIKNIRGVDIPLSVLYRPYDISFYPYQFKPGRWITTTTSTSTSSSSSTTSSTSTTTMPGPGLDMTKAYWAEVVDVPFYADVETI